MIYLNVSLCPGYDSEIHLITIEWLDECGSCSSLNIFKPKA